MDTERDLDLTKTIGHCGRFQVFLTATVFSTIAACSWGVMFMSFGNFDPGWYCLDMDKDNVSFTENTSVMYSRPLSQLLNKHDYANKTEWGLDCAVKKNCKNLLYNLESSTVVTEWDLSCDSSWIASFIISIEMFGALAGSCLSGQMGDKFGRKVTIYSHLVLVGIAHLAAMLSVSWQMYAAVFFFMGYGAGGLISSSYPFPLEFVNAWWRGVIVSVPTWSIGFIIFTFIVWLLRSWRQVHIAAAVMSLLSFLTVFWIPESVRWLTVSGRTKEAKDVIAKIARTNKRPFPNTGIIDVIAKEEKTRMGGHTYTYLDLFRISTLRGHSIKLGLLSATDSLSYYAVTFGIKSLSGNFYLNLFLSALLEIPTFLYVAPALNILGRRRACLLSFVIACIICSALVLISFIGSENVKDISIVILALFCKMVIVGVWNMCMLYSSEIFPTVVRTIQSGYLSAVARIGAIVSPFLIPNDPTRIHVPYLVIGFLCLISCGLVWSLPETNGKALRDTTHNVELRVDVERVPVQIESDVMNHNLNEKL